MLVMKFGGTSMGSAARMVNSADIIADRLVGSRVCVVVSAVGGVSNKLQASITDALGTSANQPTLTSTQTAIDAVRDIHATILDDCARSVEGFSREAVAVAHETLFEEYSRLLSAIHSFGECPESVEARVMGLGERLCVPIMAEILRARGIDVNTLDSREFIITEGGRLTEADPVLSRIEAALLPYRESGSRVLLAAGFIASDVSGKQSLLGRNGSDFSAALYAMGLAATRLEVWSDVDGIYTADPRIVPDAVLVDDISYEEAMELSFFGSKVLHPKTLIPIASRGIETWSLNSFNPSARGTRIAQSSSIPHDSSSGPVRGVSCLKDTSLVSVSGAGLKGTKGTAARVFSAVSRAGSSALLITQSSSEFTISFCVRSADAKAVTTALRAEFALESREGLINEVTVIPDMAIVSIVGDGMKRRTGVAGTFFSALAFGGINIQAIAQGSSERSISAVVPAQDGDKAVRIAHRFFFNTMQTIEVFLSGIGTVGGKLLEQISLQREELKKRHVDLQVWGISNSRKLFIDKRGIDLSRWKELLDSSEACASVPAILSFVKAEKPLNPVFVDCTASSSVPELYPEILRAGMHLVTPNKRANTSSYPFYCEIRDAAASTRKRFLYETNVGAGLPVIDTFRNMLASGDSLLSFSGILSGSLSYIFGRLDEGALFSEAVREARDKGFTEPDPRDDLSGTDVSRKALILAREAGFESELTDVVLKPLFPEGFDPSGSVPDFMQRLPSVDGYFSALIARLRSEGKVLRFAADLAYDGAITVGPVEVPAQTPLAAIKGGENAFVFTTRYYSPIPLVIRGYGAGADVTASGVFADIMRTTTW